MLLANDKWQYNYIPKSLPCGAEINQHWQAPKPVECCRTVCLNKIDKEIDLCHSQNKKANRQSEFEPPKEVKEP